MVRAFQRGIQQETFGYCDQPLISLPVKLKFCGLRPKPGEILSNVILYKYCLQKPFPLAFSYQPVPLGLLYQFGYLSHRRDPNVVDPGQHISLEETMPPTYITLLLQGLLEDKLVVNYLPTQ